MIRQEGLEPTAEDSWHGRPLTTQQTVLAELRRRILTRRWRPGSQIKPDVVASELSVSRVPVREALKILEGEGQIRYVPHSGYFVTELRFRDLVEIYRVREILEEEAARRAIHRLGQEELERLSAAAEEMESLPFDEIVRMTDANRRFHFTLLEAAEMPHLQHHIRLLWDATDPYRSLYYMSKKYRRLVHAEHRRIIEAAEAQDIDALLGAINIHRTHAIDALKGILGEDDPKEGHS